MLQQLATLGNGNPGAMTCLLGIMNGSPEILVAGLTILPKIQELNIIGTDLYVFWSDICGKDYDKMVKLCKDCPDDILIDACSRQDRSGRELVTPYM